MTNCDLFGPVFKQAFFSLRRSLNLRFGIMSSCCRIDNRVFCIRIEDHAIILMICIHKAHIFKITVVAKLPLSIERRRLILFSRN